MVELKLFLLILLIVFFVQGKCPEKRDDNVDLRGKRLCATVYTGKGDCSGYAWEMFNGDAKASNRDSGTHVISGLMYFYYQLGSVIIQDGCLLKIFRKYSFTKQMEAYQGPTVLSSPKLQHFYSYSCHCQDRELDCEPEDFLDNIKTCDATRSRVDVSCNYMKKIGVSKRTSTSMSRAEQHSFKIAFKGLGYNGSTGYNWNEASDETYSQETTSQIAATAPPGTILKIDQVVGKCGDVTIRTNFFKISHEDGKI